MPYLSQNSRDIPHCVVAMLICTCSYVYWTSTVTHTLHEHVLKITTDVIGFSCVTNSTLQFTVSLNIIIFAIPYKVVHCRPKIILFMWLHDAYHCFCILFEKRCCDGTVRLAGGSLSNKGRVEVCQSGQWKTVCDNNWSENEARVVCRQLGHSTQGIAVSIITNIAHCGTDHDIVNHNNYNWVRLRLCTKHSHHKLNWYNTCNNIPF